MHRQLLGQFEPRAFHQLGRGARVAPVSRGPGQPGATPLIMGLRNHPSVSKMPGSVPSQELPISAIDTPNSLTNAGWIAFRERVREAFLVWMLRAYLAPPSSQDVSQRAALP